MDIIKTNKKKSIFIIMTIILGLGITLGAVYFMYYYKDSRENNLNTGLVSIGFAEGSGTVNLTGEVPVVDDVGLEKTPYTFTVTNTSSIPIDAKIKLKINSLSTNIDLSAVRYGVFINSELVKKDYIHEDDLVLYTNELMTPNETINCKLVFWIDYYYEQPNKTFSATIVAEGVSRDIINGALVSFDANGGVVSPKTKTMNKTTTTYGELPTPTKDGSDFLGWFTDPTNGDEITSSTTYTFGTSATTLYAHWEGGTIPSCPDCEFMYTTNYYNYGANGTTRTKIENTDGVTLSSNYNDVITETRKYFLGVKFSGDKVEKAYACGIENDIPFCLEGYTDGSKQSANINVLNGSTPPIFSSCSGSLGSFFYCSGSVNADSNSSGFVSVGGDSGRCRVYSNGDFYCYG